MIANLAGVTLAGVAFALRDSEHAGAEAKDLLGGLLLGFCGCLSTVSTLMVELRTLATKSPKVVLYYAGATIGCAQVILLLINGVYVSADPAAAVEWAGAGGNETMNETRV